MESAAKQRFRAFMEEMKENPGLWRQALQGVNVVPHPICRRYFALIDAGDIEGAEDLIFQLFKKLEKQEKRQFD